MKPVIGIIGVGQMGGAIAKGLLLQENPAFSKLYLSDEKKVQLDIPATCEMVSNEQLAKNAEIIILAVKPFLVE